MFAVISVFSFAMAFGAIWFTSEALKRLDFNQEALLRPYLRKINLAFDEQRDANRALQARVESLEKQVRVLKLHAETTAVSQRELSTIAPVASEAQHYAPSVRLNG